MGTDYIFYIHCYYFNIVFNFDNTGCIFYRKIIKDSKNLLKISKRFNKLKI